MFILVHLLVAFLIAGILVTIFGVGYRKERLGAGLFWFFLILFLATWAGGLWLTPLGPPLFGVSWLSFLLAGLFFALLIMALLPRLEPRPSDPPPETTPTLQEQVEAGVGALFAINFFFWILAIGFFIAIVLSYLL